MRRGLYLLFEGLPGTVIDSQVLVHARDMRARGFIDFEIWAVAGSAALYRASHERLDAAHERSGGRVRLFRGVRPGLPGSIADNARRVARWLDELQPRFDLLHARTDLAAAVAARLKPGRGFKLLWDCRGDGAAEFAARYSGSGVLQRVLRHYFVRASRKRVRLAAAGCDRALFVSRSLAEQTGQGLGAKPRAVIPCGASEKLFFFDPQLRAATRRQLGYGDENRVLVYSGGLSAYQCFPESVELFRRLHTGDNHWKLLVVTPQRDQAALLLQTLPPGSWQARSARLEDVNATLNAADYGLLLRHRDPLNAAASPTKFAEYGLAGLPVVMAENSVPDSYALAVELGNLCRYRDGEVAFPHAVHRAAVSAAYRGRVSREALAENYRLLYTRAEEES